MLRSLGIRLRQGDGGRLSRMLLCSVILRLTQVGEVFNFARITVALVYYSAISSFSS
jgi:hypothetical protein